MRQISPTDKAGARAAHDQAEREQRSNLEASFNAIASTPDGQKILQYLAAACGFGQNKVLMKLEGSEVIPLEGAILYNCARESVYINNIRKYLTPDNRTKIERSL